uniref:Relaxin-like protein isoform 1 RLP1 n=1 Tax=Desmognathus ocoee TaxID=179530 RepID=A0A0H4A836_9SALA|nr:relaxin-like protein isoform 1 RLP1 [Desmognathus ocoee]
MMASLYLLIGLSFLAANLNVKGDDSMVNECGKELMREMNAYCDAQHPQARAAEKRSPSLDKRNDETHEVFLALMDRCCESGCAKDELLPYCP